MDLFEKLKLAAAGLDLLFDKLEIALNRGLAEQLRELPVVGSSISHGADF